MCMLCICIFGRVRMDSLSEYSLFLALFERKSETHFTRTTSGSKKNVFPVILKTIQEAFNNHLLSRIGQFHILYCMSYISRKIQNSI